MKTILLTLCVLVLASVATAATLTSKEQMEDARLAAERYQAINTLVTWAIRVLAVVFVFIPTIFGSGKPHFIAVFTVNILAGGVLACIFLTNKPQLEMGLGIVSVGTWIMALVLGLKSAPLTVAAPRVPRPVQPVPRVIPPKR